MRVIIEGTAKEIAELLPNLTQAEVQLETENINSNDQEMQMLQKANLLAPTWRTLPKT